uniref:DUF2254 domain-containing protein n=1 Tax=Steinernema glaseri TaxID=37863 RepID=A0A1I7Z499_9BILA
MSSSPRYSPLCTSIITRSITPGLLRRCSRPGLMKVDSLADGAHQAARRIDVAVAHVVQHGLAVALVALGIALGQAAHRPPAADVTPAQLAG